MWSNLNSQKELIRNNQDHLKVQRRSRVMSLRETWPRYEAPSYPEVLLHMECWYPLSPLLPEVLWHSLLIRVIRTECLPLFTSSSLPPSNICIFTACLRKGSCFIGVARVGHVQEMPSNSPRPSRSAIVSAIPWSKETNTSFFATTNELGTTTLS